MRGLQSEENVNRTILSLSSSIPSRKGLDQHFGSNILRVISRKSNHDLYITPTVREGHFTVKPCHFTDTIIQITSTVFVNVIIRHVYDFFPAQISIKKKIVYCENTRRCIICFGYFYADRISIYAVVRSERENEKLLKRFAYTILISRNDINKIGIDLRYEK